MTIIAQGGVLDNIKDVQQQIAPNIPVDATIGDLLTTTNIINFVFFLAGLIFFFNLLYAAWDYLLSTGDPKKIASGTQRLLNAFVGIVVVLGAFVIVRIVLAILGLQGTL
ncbi:hypothetical protein A3A84_01620 [Candidatus Collierbacteria bacterium RIFCSPLOWO2_01_FULL_50_23]|uniref:Uncharacterized protein n=2 Tax=Candidatus Collieribacteriota TaxID=1752725 RepID=A0A1F5EX19_9BACT|nr:MAG: hypothetical protein A3D09_03665 [Candidatus Collierbacteria bacterium RIFCSPHIGHO2_02_FULL_49_10]OGD72361.1 MAG: hypothetical protein A2703_02235 [Candidatus Collierbacteria bacterium RIFCSPHIGHO2_01_FULL_50_25]OGD73937.1 MAG: hypothetical protein A3A84_01620 [Candidatus Collierbacteria bacterium RIFCSPLOWO2_01_FULL_50_23]